MASKVLTDSVVQKLRPRTSEGRWREVADGACRGLSLRLSPRGERVWAVRVQVGKTRKRHILGAYPEMSLEKARQEAKALQAAARSGIGPEQFAGRLAGRSMTVSTAHRDYLEAVQADLRPRTVETKKRLFTLHIEPGMGARPLSEVRRFDIMNLIADVLEKGYPVQANRVFSELMAMLRWAEERGFVDGIPAIRKKSLRSVGVPREKPRVRVLTRDEVGYVWRCAENLGPRTRDFLRLLLLTGQRRDEVRLMEWQEVNLEQEVWTIPCGRYKTGLEHAVPLSPPVLDILWRRHRERRGPFVIPGRDPDKPFSGQASAMRRLRLAMPDGEPFTLHDFRRTVRTGISALGSDFQTCERVIGHVLPGMSNVYDMYDRLHERRMALDAWAKYVLSACDVQGSATRGAN